MPLVDLNSSATLITALLVFVHLGIVAMLFVFLCHRSPKKRVPEGSTAGGPSAIKKREAKQD